MQYSNATTPGYTLMAEVYDGMLGGMTPEDEGLFLKISKMIERTSYADIDKAKLLFCYGILEGRRR